MDEFCAGSRSINTLYKTIGPDTLMKELCYHPGEPLVERFLDGSKQAIRSASISKSLVAFHHLADSHHTDTGTGRAVEMIRQLDPGDGEFGPIYRQWACFTGATLISAVKTLNAVAHSPFTDKPVDLVVLGGDFVNNSQQNEFASFASIFSGKISRPFKRTFTLHGTRFTYEPNGARVSSPCDSPKDSSCEPCQGQQAKPASIPLYKATAKPMHGAEALKHPALFVFGNHDLEAMGHLQHSWRSSLWAIQPIKLMACKPISVPDIKGLTERLHDKDPKVRSTAWREIRTHLWRMRGNLCLAWSAVDLKRRAVTIDKAWAQLSPLFKNLQIERAGPAYYTCRPRSGVVFIMLDSVSHNGGPEGHITHRQFEWLEAELKRAEANHELAIVISHHPSYTLVEKREDCSSSGPVHLEKDFVNLLLSSKATVAHLAAHTHRNRVIAHCHPANPRRGYWEINTCSLIDWPQQFRFLELMRRNDGTVSLAMCMLNHLAPPDPGWIELPGKSKCLSEEEVIKLASYARKLSYRDHLLGFTGPAGRLASGDLEDRNVELVLTDPYA